MDFGLTGKLSEYYLAQQYQKNGAAGKSSGVSFAELAAAKAAGQSDVSGMSFKDMWQARFPGAYYHTADAYKIPQGAWQRYDFPHEKFFSDELDESIIDWKPTGAEPKLTDASVQSRIDSTLGKKAIVVPPALEEKMKNDSELAKKVMERVDSFLLTNSTPGENEGFLMTFDENGEINHACVVGELKFTVSSSEFVEARRAREAKHAEYERLAEESALKRKMLAQEADRKYYQNKAVSIAAYEAAGILK